MKGHVAQYNPQSSEHRKGFYQRALMAFPYSATVQTSTTHNTLHMHARTQAHMQTIRPRFLGRRHMMASITFQKDICLTQ